MQLTNGLYLISTIATNPWGERWVQRNLAEDRSLLPKRVDVQTGDVVPFQWTVEQVEGGENQFLLSAGRGTGRSSAWTIDADGKLAAALLDDPPPQVWEVVQCQRCEEGVFTVTGADTGEFWQTPELGEDTQISINSVILTAIFPPQYPSTVLFNFTQIIV